jgi:hypothetical protein
MQGNPFFEATMISMQDFLWGNSAWTDVGYFMVSYPPVPA